MDDWSVKFKVFRCFWVFTIKNTYGYTQAIRPHKKNYLFSVPARPDKSPRPPIFFFKIRPSLVQKLSIKKTVLLGKNGDFILPGSCM
jgi:hypothetical protein